MHYIIATTVVLSLIVSGCVSAPPPATPTPTPVPATPTPAPTPVPTTVTPSPTATPSVPPAIKVLSQPSSVNGDANFTIRWEVSGGSPGDISNTGIIWGFKSGGTNISDYPRASIVQKGKTPMQFSAEARAPAGGGPMYLRVHAVVDGTDIYSSEYQITVVPVHTPGGY